MTRAARGVALEVVAAPVFDYTRDVVAGLAVIGPATRLTAERIDELVSLVRGEAEGISRMLGSTIPTSVALGTA